MAFERVYRDVTVGGELYKDAEFFVDLKEPTWKITLFWWENLTLPFSRIAYKFKMLMLDVKLAYQRAVKGYDYLEVIDTYSCFIKRYTKILEELKKNHCGYPSSQCDSHEWEKILCKMLFHLKYMDEEAIVEEVEKQVPENYMLSLYTINKIQSKHKKAFFDLFSLYFYDLWD